MSVGYCPHCGSMMLELYELNYRGKEHTTPYKRKKAQRKFGELESEIIGKDYSSKVKYGTKTNMGFRYGDNKEVITSKGVQIKQYAVDFNGTKELV